MNKKFKIVLITVLAAIVLVVAVIVIASLVKPNAPAENSAPPVVAGTLPPTDEPENTPEPSPEHVNTVTSTLAVGGDIVMHTGLNGEAMGDTGYDYVPIFGILKDFIASADYSVCSLVTTFAEGANYTAYPLFKSPTDLAASIAQVGFNLVNTATSHCVDSFKDGIDYTLDTLDAAGLSHVGTYRTQEERDASGNRYMADINGINVAFLAYTCDTNSVPVAGFEYQHLRPGLPQRRHKDRLRPHAGRHLFRQGGGRGHRFCLYVLGYRVCHGAQRAAGRDCRFPL